MTIGGKSGNIGDRTPALWIHKTRGVYISTTLNGKPSVGKSFPTKKPSINEWTTVEISQSKMGSKYMFSLVVKGETLWIVENSSPKEFSDVHVYASSDWYVAQAGSIRGLQIANMMPGRSKTFFCQIDMFLFSFDATMEWMGCLYKESNSERNIMRSQLLLWQLSIGSGERGVLFHGWVFESFDIILCSMLMRSSELKRSYLLFWFFVKFFGFLIFFDNSLL